jgi:hypothetical protein
MTKTTKKCLNCEKEFEALNRETRRGNGKFCSIACSARFQHRGRSKIIKCANCDTKIKKQLKDVKKSKSGNLFCSKSCSAKYHNAHKKHGTRRSKIEKWIEERLADLYPNLEIHFNQTNAINAELDIYIPSLKLAFELNGVFHYEPIYGQKKLVSIQSNDKRKFQACLEKNIEFCIIDISQLKRFNKKGAEKYLNIIIKVISLKINAI